MGDPKAFLTVHRIEAGYRPVHDRIHDYSEVEQTLNTCERRTQASRCMDCGVPFCHWACPVGNRQPEWQDLLYRGRVEQAYRVLEQCCDFPEFTGRICPALCEKACVLKRSEDQPVTIRENEAAIAETAFREGYVKPVAPRRNGMDVAVVGSGPAGLAAANRLNRMGYSVTMYEKAERPGGLLRFGIPNFKLSKKIVDRRIRLMEAEGIVFKTGQTVGRDITTRELCERYRAVCLAIGAEVPRDLPVPGRELQGVHFALELLGMQNRLLQGLPLDEADRIDARGKQVLVIGGGDTGSDCVGTAIRHGAAGVTQIEILPAPPKDHNPRTPWPMYPQILKTSSSHLEGCERRWNLATARFVGQDGRVRGAEVEEVVWNFPADGSRGQMKKTGKTEIIPADLVFLALGFVSPSAQGPIEELALEKDPRGNIATASGGSYTGYGNVFAAGDAVSGASLVVRAIASGQKAAADIHRYLTGGKG